MGEMRRITAEVDGEIADEVANAIQVGDYADEDEVMREAFKLWRANRQAGLARLRAAWEEGVASGEPVEGNFDAEDVKRRGRERMALRTA